MKTALSIAGIVAASIALYFANEWRVCSSLHEDYVTFAKATLADERLRSAISDPEFDKAMKMASDERIMRAGQTLFDLKSRCGERALADAQIEAQEFILNSGPF